MTQSRITILGLFCADLICRTPRLPAWGETLRGERFDLLAGGKGSNQAIAAARQGASVQFITRLGEDSFADLAHRLYAAEGIHTDFVTIEPNTSTGTATILVDAARGENTIIVVPGACDHFTPAMVDAAQEAIAESSVFVTQLELPLASCLQGLRIANANNVPTILNPAPAPSEPLPASLYACVDIITPNETEASALVGHAVETDAQIAQAAATLRAWGVGTAIITLGERGVYIDSPTFTGTIPALAVERVVDTIGAGDAFNGVLAVGVAEGLSIELAARKACIAAGLSVTQAGAGDAMPSRLAVETLLNT